MSEEQISDAQLGIEKMVWEPGPTDPVVKSLYEQTTGFARLKVQSYYKESVRDWRRSVVIRWVSLPFAVLGAIFPLVDATGVFREIKLAPWGYIALGLAAGIYSIDRVFGYGAGASRNTVTWLKIRRALAECEFELIKAQAKPGDQGMVAEQIDRLKQLRLKVETTIAEETSSWVDEFRRQDAELQQRLAGGPGPKT